MKKPTIEQLKKMSACRDGIEWYKSVQSKSIESIIDGANDEQLHFCNWYVARAITKENIIRYAIYSAENVLRIFDEKYPDDDRPRKAIQAAKDYIDGKINADAARSAAIAAYAAYDTTAYAARSAADAAISAAYAAIAAYAAYDTTADAARSAADAACAYAKYAARSAADAACAYSDMLRDIIKYGISLMEEK